MSYRSLALMAVFIGLIVVMQSNGRSILSTSLVIFSTEFALPLENQHCESALHRLAIIGPLAQRVHRDQDYGLRAALTVFNPEKCLVTRLVSLERVPPVIDPNEGGWELGPLNEPELAMWRAKTLDTLSVAPPRPSSLAIWLGFAAPRDGRLGFLRSAFRAGGFCAARLKAEPHLTRMLLTDLPPEDVDFEVRTMLWDGPKLQAVAEYGLIDFMYAERERRLAPMTEIIARGRTP
jgi:hypothetical protein